MIISLSGKRVMRKFLALMLSLTIIITTGDTAAAKTKAAQVETKILDVVAVIPEQIPQLDTSIYYMMEGTNKTLEIDNLQGDAIANYSTTDANIANITENGEIIAIAEGDTYVAINIQQSGKTYILSVIVHVLNNSQSQMVLEQKDVKLGEGETWKPDTELVWYGAQATFAVEDESIAEVNFGGIITAKSVGTTVIRNSMPNGDSIIYTLTVDHTPDKISLPYEVKTIQKGCNFTLEPIIDSGYSNQLIFESSDYSVATVDNNGVIIAINKGTAEIKVSAYNGISAVVTIRVADEIGSFQMRYFTGKSLTLVKNQSRTIYYSVTPLELSEYAEKYITWASDNENVAVVDKNGKITGKNIGTAHITLSTSDGSVNSSTIIVNVVARKKGTSYTQKKLSIVSTSKSKYTYKAMEEDLNALSEKYGDCVHASVLTNSYDKRNIYMIVLGNPDAKKKVMVQASLHGREYMTALLTMKQIEFYCKNYYSGRYNGQYFSEMFDEVAFYIVPMANPDGVTISQYGPSGILSKYYRNKVIRLCKKYGKGKKSYYTLWKSNVRGVNLNRNFDSYWKILRGSGKANENKGNSPASERETKALVNLCNKIKPCATLSYHAMGSIIYWNFGRKGTLQKKISKLSKQVKEMTSYSRVSGFSKYHCAGFSDWVAIKKKTCAITIEIGNKACPLKIKEFPSIWKKNRLMYLLYADYFN